MASERGKLAGTVVFLALFLASCAVTTDYSKGGNPIPKNWVLKRSDQPNQCVSIDGDYETLGLGRLKEQNSLTQTRLDVVLGHAFPSNMTPEKVHISVNESTKTLTYQFGHPVNQSLSLSTYCRDGWYLSEKKVTDVYIGEGGTLDYSMRKIKLGKSSEGDLIVHLLLEAQSTSYLAFEARDTREVWSKFEALKSKN